MYVSTNFCKNMMFFVMWGIEGKYFYKKKF